jgi:enoyl-CoA hydratase/carnithine racemase
VILTGKGDCFCAGADLHEIHARSQEDDAEKQWFQDSLAYKDLFEVMLRFPKPIVAAVNGPALGAGAGLVLASDLAVGTPTAMLGFPDTRRGLVPGLAVPLLQFRLGGAAAANLLLRGQPASPAACQQLGLYADVVRHDVLWARAEQIVHEVAGGAPAAVAMTKRLLNETVGEQLGTWLSAAAAAMASARTTEAATEGVAAFVEKREPEWP